MAKKNNNLLTPLLIGLGALLIFKKKNKPDAPVAPSAPVIGKMTKQLHLLQVVNNDLIRMKKQKFTDKDIQSYMMDVLAKYSTPLFFLKEAVFKNSTDSSGDVIEDETAVRDFLAYNKDFIKEHSEVKQNLYAQMLEVYVYKLRDIIDDID